MMLTFVALICPENGIRVSAGAMPGVWVYGYINMIAALFLNSTTQNKIHIPWLCKNGVLENSPYQAFCEKVFLSFSMSLKPRLLVF